MARYSNILFDSIDITTLPGVVVTILENYRRAKRNPSRRKLARDDGTKLVSSFYDGREIYIGGSISGNTKDEFEQNYARLYRYLNELEATLSLPFAGSTRVYQASADDSSWTKDPLGKFGEFLVKFVTAKPYGEDSAYTTAFNSSPVTGSSKTYTFAPGIQGNYKVAPKITVTLSALTGGTAKYVQLTDVASGKYIRIPRTWSAPAVLIVDSGAKSVTVDGSEVDFLGTWFEMEPGSTQLAYEDDLTTRTVAVKLEYKKRDI